MKLASKARFRRSACELFIRRLRRGTQILKEESQSARISAICGSVGDEEGLFLFLQEDHDQVVGIGKLRRCWKFRGESFESGDRLSPFLESGSLMKHLFLLVIGLWSLPVWRVSGKQNRLR